ncbi:hypothetical protein ILUMI_02890 [Ignelater luminosus]|uniref:Transcription factor Adf-1 n=1 Tax=Ignelater luminosus TaxID=2038154 RepID=A0A8K0GKZ3_IGNLU|nr:hypothetical protein ILUMI_02890 [Ignelater luminosus]
MSDDQHFYFTACEDHKLVECMSQHPSIYDARNSGFKQEDKVARYNLWTQVAEEVGRTVPDCKRRWRHIRDTFIKHQRAMKQRPGWKPRWSLLRRLDFLKSASTSRRKENCLDRDKNSLQNEINLFQDGNGQSIEHLFTLTTEISEEDENRERNCKFLTTHCPNGKAINSLKRKSDEQSQEVETLKRRKEVPKDDSSDPVLIFFRSMALTVRNLEPDLIVEAKSRILAIVSELEMKSLQSS